MPAKFSLDPKGQAGTATRQVNERKSSLPLKMNYDGFHTGGNCSACGKPLAYWLTYKYCDNCLIIRRPEFNGKTVN